MARRMWRQEVFLFEFFIFPLLSGYCVDFEKKEEGRYTRTEDLLNCKGKI